MKRRLTDAIKSDLWVVVMDIISVNAAYVFALLLRYYVHSEFKSSALKYVNVYIRFSPFYTVICIVVFALFHLYNGIWRHASIADMNRIISATVVTAILHFVGTTVFFERLPNSYYIVGAAMQYIFICIIRFAYGFLRFKKKRIIGSINPSMPVIMIGDHISHYMASYFLEENPIFRPISYVDRYAQGSSLNGIPVVTTLEEALARQPVNNVVVVDPLMGDREKEKLRAICEDKGIGLHDYSWVLTQQFSTVSLTDLTRLIKKPCMVRLGNRSYETVEQAVEALDGRYSVVSISGDDLVIDIQEMVVRPAYAGNKDKYGKSNRQTD